MSEIKNENTIQNNNVGGGGGYYGYYGILYFQNIYTVVATVTVQHQPASTLLTSTWCLIEPTTPITK